MGNIWEQLLVTQDAEIAERVSRLRSHGMTTLTWDRHKGHASSYDVIDLGYNYRLDEMRAALGIQQLKKLDPNNRSRRELVQHYRNALAQKCPEVGVPFTNHPGLSSAHIMPVLLPKGVERKSVVEHLKKNKIQTSVHYPPIYHFENYRLLQRENNVLPVTEEVASRELTLPLYPGLTKEMVDRVVDCLCDAMP